MEMEHRLKREYIHMVTAHLWKQRSTCTRLKVGSVITDKDMKRILSIGYNGPGPGLPHNKCRGSEGDCGCVHAEMNAIARVDSTIEDKVVFVTTSPCEICAQLIKQANINKVYFSSAYRDDSGILLLKEMGVETTWLDPSLFHQVQL